MSFLAGALWAPAFLFTQPTFENIFIFVILITGEAIIKHNQVKNQAQITRLVGGFFLSNFD
jgi:hypothetical protein